MNGVVNCVAIYPSDKYTLLAAVVQPCKVVIMNYECGDKHHIGITSQFISKLVIDSQSEQNVRWSIDDKNRIILSLPEVNFILKIT